MSVAAELKQIALGLSLPGPVTFEDFWAGPNRETLHHVERFARGGAMPVLYLWGPGGSGKTHLLHAVCNRAEAGRAGYVPLMDVVGHGPDILDGLDALECLCIDDVQRACGRADWERALFNTFNRFRERDRRLLLSATVPPAALPCVREDLASRLRSGLVCPLRTPPAEDLANLTEFLCERRGMPAGPEVIEFMLRRIPRDVAAIVAMVERLDSASLQAQRRLTVPFVREVLALDY
jgi:DnaA family protein